MSARTLFITGASGTIGRRLCGRLTGKAAPALRCLSRNLSASPERNATWINGSLGDVSAWSAALRGSDAVVHLAGRVARATPAEFRRANVEGTRALIEACRASGVRRVGYVSTLAARGPDLRAHPHAASMLAAEELLRASGLDWTILRVGLLLGPRTPWSARLASLARLPLVPCPGSARVQPLHLDDVALALSRWFDEPAFDGAVHELGGPEVLPVPELLARARAEFTGARGRLLPLPGKALIALVRPLEGWLGPLLPLRAGELHELVHDGVAGPGSLAESLRGELTPLDEMLRELAGKPRRPAG